MRIRKVRQRLQSIQCNKKPELQLHIISFRRKGRNLHFHHRLRQAGTVRLLPGVLVLFLHDRRQHAAQLLRHEPHCHGILPYRRRTHDPESGGQVCGNLPERN